MRTIIFFPLIVFAALVLVVAWASGRRASAEEEGENLVLPHSCTIMELAPGERALHLERLEMLRRSASAVRILPEGFRFEVDLRRMPRRDLEAWAENEQKCCSYLKIDRQVMEAEKRATVRVVCDAEWKTEVMESFGLRASK